jgi:hypothetical protein
MTSEELEMTYNGWLLRSPSPRFLDSGDVMKPDCGIAAQSQYKVKEDL